MPVADLGGVDARRRAHKELKYFVCVVLLLCAAPAHGAERATRSAQSAPASLDVRYRDARRTLDRRRALERSRLRAPGRALRRHRSSPVGLGSLGARGGVGRRSDARGRARERPLATGQSAALGAWRRARRDGRARTASVVDPRIRAQRRHAEERHHRRSGRGQQLHRTAQAAGGRRARQDRPLRRAVHKLRRNGALPQRWRQACRRGRRRRLSGALGRSRRACAPRTPARCPPTSTASRRSLAPRLRSRMRR